MQLIYSLIGLKRIDGISKLAGLYSWLIGKWQRTPTETFPFYVRMATICFPAIYFNVNTVGGFDTPFIEKITNDL